MSQNIFINSLKFITLDISLDFIYFPIWWYTGGVKKITSFCLGELKLKSCELNLRIWFKNMFVPMYQDYSISGRLISFFIRVVVLVFRLIQLSLWLLILMGLFLFYLILPIFVIWRIFLFFF